MALHITKPLFKVEIRRYHFKKTPSRRSGCFIESKAIISFINAVDKRDARKQVKATLAPGYHIHSIKQQ